MTFTISYSPLWETLKTQNLHQIDLVKRQIISPAALKKLQRGEPVSLNVVGTLCVALGVTVENVVTFKAMDGI